MLCSIFPAFITDTLTHWLGPIETIRRILTTVRDYGEHPADVPNTDGGAVIVRWMRRPKLEHDCTDS